MTTPNFFFFFFLSKNTHENSNIIVIIQPQMKPVGYEIVLCQPYSVRAQAKENQMRNGDH